ncbi:MAG: divalent-cation tolerance protein CutA [Deltaproteobacteria bacterium CG11_big_fil_rev_8_21_14_0_20_47_16]|nr:MAG: divalent-cation tolerance protein CutA [Deltaproteobacteria bacterium CG11_big_fil_rev_8_21_14_0_20_47_16]
MSDVVILLTSIDTEERATVLARELVDRELAACVHIHPKGKSFYKWDGKHCAEDEFQLVIKTTATEIDVIKKIFPELHPYKVPELIALPVVDGGSAYLDWVRKAVE